MAVTRRPGDFYSLLVLFHTSYSLTTTLLKINCNITFPYLLPQSNVPSINIFTNKISYKFIILLELCARLPKYWSLSFFFLTKQVFPFTVLGTRSDPVPGWIDNYNGATGVVVGVGLGIIRTLHINEKTLGDMVPCDMAVSALVAAAWHIQERRRCHSEHC